jgi:hypothetical protein
MAEIILERSWGGAFRTLHQSSVAGPAPEMKAAPGISAGPNKEGGSYVVNIHTHMSLGILGTGSRRPWG